MKFFKLVFVAVLIVFMGTPFFSIQAKSVKSEYKQALKKATRHAKFYQTSDLHAKIIWHATFFSPDFLEAMTEKVAHIYDYLPQQKEAYRNSLIQKYKGTATFFVSFYSMNYSENDLANKKNNWQIQLRQNENRYAPFHIEKIKPNPLQKELFPYVNLWSDHYIITFKIPNFSNDFFELVVNGPTAHSTLKW